MITAGHVYVMNATAAACSGVSSGGGGYDELFDWSPDGTMLAFDRITDGVGAIYIDERQRRRPARADAEPERRRLLGRLVAGRQEDRLRPHRPERVRRHLGDERRRLGAEAADRRARADDFGSAWSPDGKKIAFMSNRTGRYQIYVMTLGGGPQAADHAIRPTTPASRTGRPTARKIAFQQQVGGNYEIFVVERRTARAAPADERRRTTTPTRPGRRTASRSRS